MAAGRMVNLGQVGFGLVAETDQLKASLELLKAFGREVDRLSKQTSESSQALFRKFSPLEGTLTRMTVSTEQTIRKLRDLGASETEINKITQAFRKAHDEVVKFAEDIQPNRIQRATIGLSAIQSRAVAEASAAKKVRDEQIRQQELANRELDRQHAQALSMNRRFDEEKIRAQTRFAQFVERERQVQQRRDFEVYQQSARDYERAQQEKIRAQSRFSQFLAQEQARQIAESNRQALANNRQATAVSTLGARANAAGIDPRFMQTTQTALMAFTNTPIADPTARTQAYITLRNAIAATHAEILRVNGGASNFSMALRDLERAAILAVGPLSGIGARLAVLSALFDSASFKTAATIAALTGVSTVFYMVGAGAVRATMDMQKFDAQLTAATGSSALSGDEFRKVAAFAKEWGINVRELVEPYAKFTAAARLSNMELDDQRMTFEAITISSRALHLSAERTNLIFLAFEQMVSKGTVTMEELRRQLGDLLPGAFAIAAKSMGMTQAEFSKAVANGEILAKDLVPRLSAALITIFGPSAQVAAHNLQAEMERFKNSLFETQVAFDRATNITEHFTTIVRAATGAIVTFAQNIDIAIGVVGGLAGAAGMMLLVANFTRVTAAIAAATAALAAFRAGVTASGLAVAAAGLAGGPLVALLGRLALVIGAAVAGFIAMRPATKDAVDGLDEWINKSNEYINIQQKIGTTDKVSAQLMMEAAATRYRTISAEIERVRAAIQEKSKLQEVNNKLSSDFPAVGPMGQRIRDRSIPVEDPELKALRERLSALQNLQDQIKTIMEQIGALPKELESDLKPMDTAWENFFKKIQSEIRELDSLSGQIAMKDHGKDAMRMVEAQRQALDVMTSMPKKDKDAKEVLQEQERLYGTITEQLRKLGVETDFTGSATLRLQHALTLLFFAQKQQKEILDEVLSRPERIKQAGEAYNKMMDDLRARITAATTADPAAVSAQKQLEQGIAQIDRLFGTIQNFDPEQLTKLKEEFRQLWQTATDAEKAADEVKKLREQIDQLENTLGGRGERIQEKLRDQSNLIARALERGVIDHQKATDLMERANNDAYNKLLSRATLFGKALQEVFRDLETSLTKALVDPLFGIENSWENFFNNLARMVLEFGIRIRVIQPILEALFGGAYTGSSTGGEGILGPILARFGIEAFRGVTGTPISPELAGMDAQNTFILEHPLTNLPPDSGVLDFFEGFATGGSFKVGGSGGDDSQLVAFRGTPGEMVSIKKPGQSGDMPQIVIHMHNESGTPVQAKSNGPRIESDKIVFDLFLTRLARDSGAREMTRRMLMEPQH